jgi:hypothetical protein
MFTTKILRLSSVILVATGCPGCGEQQWVPNEWGRSHPKPGYFNDEAARSINEDDFGLVRNDNEDDALRKLTKVSAVEISSEEAEKYLGKTLGGTGGKFVLLRALGITKRHQGFSVTWREGAVLVRHVDTVIGRPKPAVRRAIVARLPDLPKEVYVDYGIAN